MCQTTTNRTPEEQKAWEIEQSWKAYQVECTPYTLHDYRRIMRIARWCEQGGLCLYCGVEMEEPERAGKLSNSCTLEHIQARKDNGSDLIDNLAVACYWCNTRKGDMTEDEFRAFLLTSL